jgi:hypothetical protein
MIVGFDQDDPTTFDEQYDFLQEAQIPIVMLNLLLAAPKTPLYQRLEKAGRLDKGWDFSRYEGTHGGTNFRPLNMTAEELSTGQANLYRRIYAPEAFAERLLGNLRRFHDVTYRPEAVRLDKLVTFWQLMRHYGSKGNKARRFFWGILRETLRHSRRSLSLVVLMLGMYKHFCELHTQKAPWDPWAASKWAKRRPTVVAWPN